jgi:CubicO group peptidase (beta-lactamase class C family)
VVLAFVVTGCSSGAPAATPGTTAGSVAATASGTIPSSDPAKEADVLAIVRQAMDEYKLKAAIVRVTIDGQNVATAAMGESMTGQPATTDMHFRNGSVAESYMTNLLLQLVDAKTVSLDDKVSTWLPDLPHADEVTLGQLASMTSGYHDYVPNPDFLKVNDTQVFKVWTPEEILQYADLPQPLLYQPGTNWSYAHTNYVILGLALEKITGEPLDKALQEKVLGPLGLTNTTDPGGPMLAEPALHAYDSEQRSVYGIPSSLPFYAESTYWNTSWSLARGSIETTNIFDMDATAIAIGSGKLLSPASHQAMVSTQNRDQGGPIPGCDQCHRGSPSYTYGMGVVIKGDWLLQDPLVNGYSALEADLPSQKIAISLALTYDEPAFDTTTGSYANRAPQVFEQIADKLAPNDPAPTDPSENTPPPGG